MFLYFNKKMQNVTNWEASFRKYPSKKKSHGWERAWLSTFTTWGATRYSKSLGFLLHFFPMGSLKWFVKDFYFHPENWGKWSNLTSIFFELGWNHQKLKWLPSRSLTGLPLKSDQNPIGKDRLPSTTTVFQRRAVKLQGYGIEHPPWFRKNSPNMGGKLGKLFEDVFCLKKKSK